MIFCISHLFDLQRWTVWSHGNQSKHIRHKVTDIITSPSCNKPALLKIVGRVFLPPLPILIFSQGIIQKKSASGCRTLPFITFNEKVSFFPKIVLFYFKVFLGKTTSKVPFFKDFGCCPKILDYTLFSIFQNSSYPPCSFCFLVALARSEMMPHLVCYFV